MATFNLLAPDGIGTHGRPSPLVDVRVVDPDDERSPDRRHRRDRRAGHHRHVRLLEPAGVERAAVARRLAPHQRPRALRSRRLVHVRRTEDPDAEVGRGEHLSGRGRELPEGAPRGRRLRGDRRPRPAVGAVGQGDRRAGAGCRGDRRRARRALQGPDGLVQEAEGDRVRRRTAPRGLRGRLRRPRCRVRRWWLPRREHRDLPRPTVGRRSGLRDRRRRSARRLAGVRDPRRARPRRPCPAPGEGPRPAPRAHGRRR